MSSSAFADTPVGRIINSLSKGALLKKPDQQSGWSLPSSLSSANVEKKVEKKETESPSTVTATNSADQPHKTPVLLTGSDLETRASRILPVGTNLSRAETISRAVSIRSTSKAVASSDAIIVDWYGPDDPENPKNFSTARKVLITFAINILTFSVYAGSSIITPSIPGVMEYFGVSEVVGVLTLSLFVLGYGVGPLLLGPPADIPAIGRSWPYVFSMVALVLFNVGAAKTETLGGLLVLRFLAGVAGSPALATGGATLGDVWSDLALPKAISIWAIGAVAGPVLAPVIGGWAAQNVSFRLPYWLFVAMSGIGLLATLFLLPETLPANILLRRAKRLRKLTGDSRLKSQGEIDQAAIKYSEFLVDAFYMPIRISLEPIVLYSSVLLGLVYAIFYAAFEATPIIFGEIHGFNLGQQQLPYLGLGVNAFFITLPFYLLYLKYYFDPRFIANLQKGIIHPEDRIILSILTAPLVLISLFWIGWTSRPDVSYWSPLVALSLYLSPVFLLFQSILVYLSFSYVEHQGAVLAANDLIRSSIAAGFPIFARAMFNNLGLGKAYSMLAGISAALLIPLFGLYKYGPQLRAWSKYAHNYENDVPKHDAETVVDASEKKEIA